MNGLLKSAITSTDLKAESTSLKLLRKRPNVSNKLQKKKKTKKKNLFNATNSFYREITFWSCESYASRVITLFE